MSRIYIVLSNMSGLLRDIVVDALSSEPDIEISGEAHSVRDLERILETSNADIVVAAQREAALTQHSRELLRNRARPKLLLLTDSGSAAYLHWLKPETRPLGQLTPDSLVHEIRAATRLQSDWHGTS